MALQIVTSIISMFAMDHVIITAQAEESSQKPQVVQIGPPRPAYRIPHDQRFEVARKRFEQQRKDDETAVDPHADMLDPNWINKP